jgi:hypothetical protein
MAELSVARLNFVSGLEKLDQKPYNSSIKPLGTMPCDELQFSIGGSALEAEKSDQEVKTACSTILLKFAANGLQQRTQLELYKIM